MLAVGGHLWGKVDDCMVRMASGFGGGLAGSEQELCGALTGGAMVIGAQYGRSSADQDDSVCVALVSRYRERFLERFGTTRCFELQQSGYGSERIWPCSTLVRRATRILLGILDEQAGQGVA